jgi:hypothetical protein
VTSLVQQYSIYPKNFSLVGAAKAAKRSIYSFHNFTQLSIQPDLTTILMVAPPM